MVASNCVVSSQITLCHSKETGLRPFGNVQRGWAAPSSTPLPITSSKATHRLGSVALGAGSTVRTKHWRSPSGREAVGASSPGTDGNSSTGSPHSRVLSYLPAPLCLEAEPTDRLASEDTDAPLSQVGGQCLGQHLQPSTE